MSKISRARAQKKNAGTQTSTTDVVLEIARLQEQVKLLTIENEHLRKYTNEEPSSSGLKSFTPVTSPATDNETPRHTRVVSKNLQTPSTQRKTKGSVRGCTCKGTCSSKLCGCMKKSIACGELCKCNSSVCENQVHENMDQNKENLENIELTKNHVKNKETTNKSLANAASKSMFSPDVAKDDVDQLRASTLYFGSPNQLTFGSDKEEKEKEEIAQDKENKRTIKNNKNEQKAMPKKRGRPKKGSAESNNAKEAQKIGSNSSEEEVGQGEKKTKNRVRKILNSSDSDPQLSEELKEIDDRINNFKKNIANGMVSLRRSYKRTEQTLVDHTKRNVVISDSDSKEETSFLSEKSNSKDEIYNNNKSFEETEIRLEETPSRIKNEASTINEDGNNDFNPMKPKHELSRTPVHGSSVSRDNSDISVSMCVTLQEEERQIPEEFSQPEVDWEQYQSQLVACTKCKRKFHPIRIQKHEVCCKKV